MAEKFTNTTITISGSTAEAYFYQGKSIVYDFVIPEKYRVKKSKILVVDEESRLRKIESRRKGMQRARSTLRRLISANAWKWKKNDGTLYLPVFVTFTFAKNVEDIKTANRLFSRFIKRLNYYVGHEKKSFLKYVIVTEFQKRGAIHFHTIFFNLEFIWKSKIEELWGQGFAKIKSIESVSNVGAYICKYMSKEFEDERLDSKKRYFTSRKLNKPVVIKNQEDARSIISQIPKEFVVSEKEFDSVHLGKVKYVQYQIDKERSFVDVVPELGFFL